MRSDFLSEGIFKSVKPHHIRSYAIARGWNRIQNANPNLAIFERPESGDEQLLVPTDERLDDYSRRVRDVIGVLAEFERRDPSDVLGDLMSPDADILRYRVISAATARGSIPLAEGIKLFEGAKKSILAAACSVVNPVSHHPRMTRIEAVQLLASCHLGQTERKSFGISVLCPLRAVEQDQSLLPGASPFTRRAVLTLIRSLQLIVTSIENDAVPSMFEVNTDEGPVVSANLCEAILQMQPQDENSSLVVGTSWASSLPCEDRVPSAVHIKREYFPIIEDISSKLRPSHLPAESMFYGYVESLAGHPDGLSLLAGEAILRVLHEEQLELVRADLSGEPWKRAYEALGRRGVVQFKGVFHRGVRSHRIVDITDFDVLP